MSKSKKEETTSKRTSLILGLALLLMASGSVGVLHAGTSISVMFDDPVVTCNTGADATVTFNYTVTSMGAANEAIVTAKLNDNLLDSTQTIASGNIATGGGWTFAGQVKTADGSYTTSLPNGTYTLEVCATQAGANGNPNKTGCYSQTVTINCTSLSPCASSARSFGEIPANKNVCSNKANVEIQFSGDFGDSADLTIDGPEDFSLQVEVPRAGDSCNYHYNWVTRDGNNGGEGPYILTVNGNGLVYTRVLKCE